MSERIKTNNTEIKKVLIDLIHNAYIDAMNKSGRILEILNIPSATKDFLAVQFYYDEYYNRTFIEFEISRSIRDKYDNYDRIIKKIHSYINNNFYKLTDCYPEIIAYDDGVNERYDSIFQLSTYTIGYWKCLHANYEFLYSHQIFMHNMNGLNIPTYPEEFVKAREELYKNYYISDPKTFYTKLQELRNRYKIDSDLAPAKKIEDFENLVSKLRDKYSNYIDPKDRDKYIEEYMSTNGDTEKVKVLNNKYKIKDLLHTKIPEIMKEYKKIYKNFFGANLHDINGKAEIFYIVESI